MTDAPASGQEPYGCPIDCLPPSSGQSYLIARLHRRANKIGALAWWQRIRRLRRGCGAGEARGLDRHHRYLSFLAAHHIAKPCWTGIAAVTAQVTGSRLRLIGVDQPRYLNTDTRPQRAGVTKISVGGCVRDNHTLPQRS